MSRLTEFVPDRVLVGGRASALGEFYAFIDGGARTATRALSSSRFSFRGYGGVILSRFRGDDLSSLSLRGGGDTIYTLNTTLSCLCGTREGSLGGVGDVGFCSSSEFAGVNLSAEHGLRVARAVHSHRGGKSLL